MLSSSYARRAEPIPKWTNTPTPDSLREYLTTVRKLRLGIDAAHQFVELVARASSPALRGNINEHWPLEAVRIADSLFFRYEGQGLSSADRAFLLRSAKEMSDELSVLYDKFIRHGVLYHSSIIRVVHIDRINFSFTPETYRHYRTALTV